MPGRNTVTKEAIFAFIFYVICILIVVGISEILLIMGVFEEDHSCTSKRLLRGTFRFENFGASSPPPPKPASKKFSTNIFQMHRKSLSRRIFSQKTRIRP